MNTNTKFTRCDMQIHLIVTNYAQTNIIHFIDTQTDMYTLIPTSKHT